MEGTEVEVRLLKEYPRAIFHMRRQLRRKRFGLVFGAGLCLPWKLPTWSKLNKRIAKDRAVSGEKLLKSPCSETVRTQRLFEHFKMKSYASVDKCEHNSVRLNRRIRKEWRDILHRQLYNYSLAKKSTSVCEEQHPYISAFVNIMLHSPLTVNYNFDDFLERILAYHRSDQEKERTRGYETTWDLRFPFRYEERVIYHPNGYLPYNPMEASDEIVLLEGEFAEQLLGAMTGRYTSLVHHFCRNTCLLIGLSLDDAMLKNCLRQVAQANPGQYQYYVQYYKSRKPFAREEKEAIAAANFYTYNLVTLFLCDEEIAALGTLVGDGCDLNEHKDTRIRTIAQENDIETNYRYYIVGAVGAGKSTVVKHFRNLIAYDEWFEPRALELGKDPAGLPEKKIGEIDEWIINQFRMKNNRLAEEPLGIFIIDRCPLDPVSFTPGNEWNKKADKLLTTIAPGPKQQVVEGHVILLINDPDVLDMRLIMSEKEYKRDRLQKMQDDLKNIYDILGVTALDAKEMSLPEIIKTVARKIFVDKYIPADINGRLEGIKDGSVTCQT